MQGLSHHTVMQRMTCSISLFLFFSCSCNQMTKTREAMRHGKTIPKSKNIGAYLNWRPRTKNSDQIKGKRKME
ncbi:hypothetical protein M758_UG164600 [Ceratodon purpureus]|nr:hypothetical protein M758_UG164600 [Ceratodon purpureus]